MENKTVHVTRRAVLVASLGATVIPRVAARADDVPVLRLGILKFGTVQWVGETIRLRGLDAAHGFRLEMSSLANNDAGRVALMAQSADIVVSDWFFVASQRNAGTALTCAPFTSASGGLMVAAGSPIAGIADLKGRRLGVAGGPLDKSWLLFQAAAHALASFDVASAVSLNFGAPPLLSAKLRQGELDAVLTFWNFCARVEADGFRQVISVADCARALKLPEKLSLIGFVFREDWARAPGALVAGFLGATAEAEHILATDDSAWQPIRPLMEAPAEALFTRLRKRFVDGIDHPSYAEQTSAAARLFEIVLRTGGTRATGDMDRLPEGVFWRGT